MKKNEKPLMETMIATVPTWVRHKSVQLDIHSHYKYSLQSILYTLNLQCNNEKISSIQALNSKRCFFFLFVEEQCVAKAVRLQYNDEWND